jgi:hypothetical protein
MHTNYCQIPANSAFEAPANAAFEAPKAELAVELTDSLENIRYLLTLMLSLWYNKHQGHTNYCQIPANSAFEAPKVELAVELTEIYF